MTGTTHSSAIGYTRTEQSVRDASWYGTLGLVAGCCLLLLAAFFVA